MANYVLCSSIIRALEPLKRPPVYHTQLQNRLHLSGHSQSFHYIIELCVNGLVKSPENEAFLEARIGYSGLSYLDLVLFRVDGRVAESLHCMI